MIKLFPKLLCSIALLPTKAVTASEHLNEILTPEQPPAHAASSQKSEETYLTHFCVAEKWTQFDLKHTLPNNLIEASILNLAQAHFIQKKKNLAPQVATVIEDFLRNFSKIQGLELKLKKPLTQSSQKQPSTADISKIIYPIINNPNTPPSLIDLLSSIQPESDNSQVIKGLRNQISTPSTVTLKRKLTEIRAEANDQALEEILGHLIDADWTAKCHTPYDDILRATQLSAPSRIELYQVHAQMPKLTPQCGQFHKALWTIFNFHMHRLNITYYFFKDEKTFNPNMPPHYCTVDRVPNNIPFLYASPRIPTPKFPCKKLKNDV